MSNNDSKDEEKGKILPDAPKSTDDSKEPKSDEFNEYERDNRDPLENEDMDDKQW